MAMLHQDCASGASGVLKLNSKMLQPSDLRKLDKLEKSVLVEMGRSGKGETGNLDFVIFLHAENIPLIISFGQIFRVYFVLHPHIAITIAIAVSN